VKAIRPTKPMTVNRRMILKGMGGVALGIPFLGSVLPRAARAQSSSEAPQGTYAIFFRQANGVAQQTNTDLGSEPERFFPREFGALTTASMADRAVGELVDYRQKLLVLSNVNMQFFSWGDGHAAGCLQALTARGPVVPDRGGSSEAAGESIDHRIGRELNPEGRDSLFMFCGQAGGWLNGPSISYRSSGVRRTALHNPFNAYQTLVGAAGGLSPAAREQIAVRGRSVNDLVRDQLAALRSNPRLSAYDRDRLQLHLDSVRDIEVELGCRMSADEEAALEGAAPGFDSTNGDEVLETARLHMDIAVLAVSCGLTRSVAIQVGVGNDGNTRYRNLQTGQLMENYHFISHRRSSHDSSGGIIANSDLLHHFVDRHFARTFRHLLDRLSAQPGRNGGTLLDDGVSAWYNDNAKGPPHSITNVPWVLAGGCAGFFKQGQHLRVANGASGTNHSKLLNTIGSAVGVRNASGGFLDNFGDSSLPRGILDELRA
jgi:hypothetical protein